MSSLTATDIENMVSHWINTPCGTYLGSNYGNSFADYLNTPLNSQGADAIVSKLLADIPIIDSLGRNIVAINAVPGDIDSIQYQLTIAGLAFEVPL